MLRYSVIVPAFNCADVLENTINSILHAGLHDFEIIIVDDGSSDGTDKVCKTLSELHACVRVIRQENAGVSAARNRGIEEAKGEYVLFFDADDSVDENAFCHAVEIIERKAPDMLIFGMSFDYYHSGRMYRRDELCYPEEICLAPEQWGEEFPALYACNALSPVWNKFIRRGLLADHAVRFNGDVFEMEDFLFSIGCLRHCKTIYMLPEAIYRYRQAEDERGTYNRLCRVDSLTAYMKSFEQAVERLEKSLAEQGACLRDGEEVVRQIYAMLFHEQIRFADKAHIEKAAGDMLRGKYAEPIAKASPELYDDLKNGRFGKVYAQRLKNRLRHFAAVRYKYLRSL